MDAPDPGVEIARLLCAQDGVVSRAQVRAAGAPRSLIERRIRRREWVRLIDGVYVDHAPIHLVVDTSRHLVDAEGYRVHRVQGIEDRIQWNARPPRLRIEHAAIELAAQATTEHRAIQLLADVCQSGGTTAERIGLALAGRRQVPHKGFLTEVLLDVGAGTCSVLEREYLVRVERAHGLPDARRQTPQVMPSGRPSAGPVGP